ncbi:MAG: hypothetical protein CMP22_00150 [Rickettsiales bacterium]|nr:hypothetical protein [Rickettsiales bacterium]
MSKFNTVKWIEESNLKGFDENKQKLSKAIIERAQKDPMFRTVFQFVSNNPDVITDSIKLDECFKIAQSVAEFSDVNTQENKALVFSGFHRMGAEDMTIKNPTRMEMIHTCPAGFFLEELNLFSKHVPLETIYAPWFAAGKRYAAAASGNVNLVINGKTTAHNGIFEYLDRDLPPENTFRSVELPELLGNDKVTMISGLPKWSFEKLVTDNFESYVDNASVEQTQRRAKAKEKWREKCRQWNVPRGF